MKRKIVLSTITLTAGLVILLADSAKINLDAPFSETVITCSGDALTLNGIAHEEATAVVNGNTAHIDAHINLQASGLGSPSGTSYTFNSTAIDNEEVDIDPVTLTGEQTIVVEGTLVAQGSAPNERARLQAHITINADGTITIEKVTVSDICQ
jgi:hypothetical protein